MDTGRAFQHVIRLAGKNLPAIARLTRQDDQPFDDITSDKLLSCHFTQL
jgi:hypothetical protein